MFGCFELYSVVIFLIVLTVEDDHQASASPVDMCIIGDCIKVRARCPAQRIMCIICSFGQFVRVSSQDMFRIVIRNVYLRYSGGERVYSKCVLCLHHSCPNQIHC